MVPVCDLITHGSSRRWWTAVLGPFFICSVTQFVNYVLSGKAPTQLGPCFAAALQKKNDGVRPIAVGESLRRLISSCAMNKVSSAATKFSQPLRLGIATKNGTKSVVYAVRRVCQQYGKKSECGMLSIDLTNAFNLVRRNAFLREMQDNFPSLSYLRLRPPDLRWA